MLKLGLLQIDKTKWAYKCHVGFRFFEFTNSHWQFVVVDFIPAQPSQER